MSRRLVKRLLPGVSVMRCQDCDGRAIDPMPSNADLSAHYESYYLTRSADDSALETQIALHEPVARWLLAKLPGSGRRAVLDYGFGSGAFLLQMARLGQATFGADVSRQNVSQLKANSERNGISMQLVDLSRQSLAAFNGRKFDLITLFQVVEHLTKPSAQIRQLAEGQSREGRIYVECPNDAAVLAWLKRFSRITPARKAIWGSLKYPEHLHGFNRRSLTQLLERAGYEVEACGDYSYRDGMHQIEAESWWPRFRNNPDLLSVYGLSRSVIPVVDQAMSILFHSGSGLFALGRKAG